MDPTKNLRYVEGEEESVGLSSDSCENENENEIEIEDEIEKIATQKNRERFAIKKTYSVEVCLLLIIIIKMHQCIAFSTFYFWFN